MMCMAIHSLLSGKKFTIRKTKKLAIVSQDEKVETQAEPLQYFVLYVYEFIITFLENVVLTNDPGSGLYFY